MRGKKLEDTDRCHCLLIFFALFLGDMVVDRSGCFGSVVAYPAGYGFQAHPLLCQERYMGVSEGVWVESVRLKRTQEQYFAIYPTIAGVE